MKFLSKLKDYFLKGLAIWTGFSPLFVGAVPGSADKVQIISKDLSAIGDAIGDAELIATKLPGATGAQKLQIATPLVADVILKSAMLANHSIANPDLFTQGAGKVADGMADIVNSLKTDGLDAAVVKKS